MQLAWVFACVGAGAEVMSGRSAAFDSPRIVMAYSDLPLCEMSAKSEDPATATGLLQKWWTGIPDQRAVPIDLSQANGMHEICRGRLRRRDAKFLKELALDKFWYSYVLENGKEVRVPVGQVNATNVGIYSHKTFHVFKRPDGSVAGLTVVPSVLVPIAEDKELRMTYDVIHDDVHEYPKPEREDLLTLYSATAFASMAWLLKVAFRKEARQCPSKAFNAACCAHEKSALHRIAVVYAIGSQVALSVLLASLFSIVQEAVGKPSFGVYTWLTSFTLAQTFNGWSLFRTFRIYNDTGKETSSAVAAAVMVLPCVCLVIIWQLSCLFAAFLSSRSISIYLLAFKFVLYALALVPLQYTGAFAAMQFKMDSDFPPKQQATALVLSPNSNQTPFPVLTLLPFLLAQFPVCAFMCQQRFLLDSIFWYNTNIPSAWVTLCGLYSLSIVTVVCSLASLYINLAFNNTIWSSSPKWIGVGFFVGSSVLAAMRQSQYSQSLIASIDYFVTATAINGLLSLAVFAVSYSACERFLRKNAREW